jgi:hypothetical protein
MYLRILGFELAASSFFLNHLLLPQSLGKDTNMALRSLYDNLDQKAHNDYNKKFACGEFLWEGKYESHYMVMSLLF